MRIIERFLLADVHADLPVPRDSAAVWLHGAGMLGAFPLPGKDLWRLMAPAPDNASDEGSTQEVQNLLTGILHERSGCPLSAVRATVWTSTFRIHRRLANRFRRLDGTTTRLHAELGGHWALLTPSGTPPQVAQACADRARDRLGTATVNVLTPPAARPTQIVLVRPDGHAGWCGQPSPTALDEWLTGILRHGSHQGQTCAGVAS